ncbi:SpoIIE family protein phosphatase [Streptomyces albus subsp. chlorinus]|uniref:ATP-binding SpoIIE family protein phosphatase n=1 Tax=Streptomyces albus TaxID=1888 RepID=UPI00156F8685|nr:ATP-binding SpoIIE family protein phosphatase [Streptomyces albus]NSC23682.1 SpoIIE family protein phosphatase [Streptomyces albus subsp. chlorinus]
MSDIPVEAAGKQDDVRRALALLNAAGARIGNSLDLETTARELLDVAVPQFCDLASVDLYESVLAGDEPRPVGPSGPDDPDGFDDPAPGRAGAANGVPRPGQVNGTARSGLPHRRRGPVGSPRGELRRVAFASAVSDAPSYGLGMPDDDSRVDPWADARAGRTHEAARARHNGAASGPGVRPGPPAEVGTTHCYAEHSPYAVALRTGRVQNISGQDGNVPAQFGAVVQSTLAVPMVARDRVLGLAQFSRAKGSEPFGERDGALAAELAARAAVCIDNARLYRREHERALILQRSLLPPGDPEAAGLEIACRYLPGNPATEVGGDWFDVIELPGHRTAIVVGDVMGRGLRAAVAMGELRTAVRTLALTDMEPAEVLGALDEIARGLGDTRRQHPQRTQRGSDTDLSEVYLATCIYAVYDPVSRRCTFANAGHLPPIMVEPDEPALLLEVPKGVPLGVGGEPFEEIEIELPQGAMLALYTDGLVESRDHPLDEGLDRFRSALTDAAEPLEDTADRVLRTLNVHHGEDDIALLVARVQGLAPENVGDWTLPPEPRSVARARELAREQLASWDLDALGDTAELLVSELVTNALRYGEGNIRLRLLLERTLVCEVWDAGQVQPRRRRARDTDEGGRGLQLVDLLSTGWGSRRVPSGKAVWFQLPRPEAGTAAPDPTEALLSLF